MFALVVLLSAAGYALVPFHPDDGSERCGPAPLYAFRTVPTGSGFEGLASKPGWSACPGPARSRLATATIVAVLAVIGGLVSVRILEEPPPAER